MHRYALLLLLPITSTASADVVKHYRAVLDNTGATAPGGAASAEIGMTGQAAFTLTIPGGGGSPTLAYEVVLQGVDFGLDADPNNDISAMHLHDTTGVDHTAATPHVLNIFGFPSQDDDDMDFDPVAATITGVWDDSDLTDPGLPHAGNPGPNSDTLTSSLAALEAGELYLMLHTTSLDALPGGSGITIGGRIVEVPEPAAALLALVALAAALAARV